MLRLLLLCASLALATGCASTLSPAASALEHAKRKLAKCRVLGVAHGESGFNGWVFPAEQRARAEALEHAATMGGTHVLFTESTEGFMGGKAACLVYQCQK